MGYMPPPSPLPRPQGDEIDPPAIRTRQPRPQKRKSPWIARAVLASMIAICVAGGYVGYLAWKSPIIGRMFSNPTVANQFPGVASLNLLVIGRDYDYNNSDQVIKTKARSDMLMVAHLDFTDNSVKLLSIPRDTRALIPGHGFHKINSAHAFGGPLLTSQTVTGNYGIPIDHYMSLDFQGFEKSIDLLHGVDVNVDKKMDYDDNWGHLHIHLLPGQQHLNGEQAMGFVRFRHADNDVVRTTRQQALIGALKLKLLQPATLVALPSIINTIDKHTASDFTADQKIAVARFIREAPKDKVQMQTLPSVEGDYYVTTDWKSATPLIKNWFGVVPPKVGHHRHRLERSRLVAEAL